MNRGDAKVDALVAHEKWDEAVEVMKRMAVELHVESERVFSVLSKVRLDVAQLKAENSCASWWLLAEALTLGVGGLEQNLEEAHRCTSRAADMGMLLAQYLRGAQICLGLGVEADVERGASFVIKATEMGCSASHEMTAVIYEYGLHAQQSYRKAAQFYLMAAESRGITGPALARLLSEHPLESAPLGLWTPRWHPLVPVQIRAAMRAAMLLCKRARLPRYVASIVASYVCTEGEEWQRLLCIK